LLLLITNIPVSQGFKSFYNRWLANIQGYCIDLKLIIKRSTTAGKGRIHRCSRASLAFVTARTGSFLALLDVAVQHPAGVTEDKAYNQHINHNLCPAFLRKIFDDSG